MFILFIAYFSNVIMHQRSAGAHHFLGTRRLQEPSDGEQSVQSSAYKKLFFPACGQKDRISQKVKKQTEALIVLKLQYILGYGICLTMSLMAEVLKRN